MLLLQSVNRNNLVGGLVLNAVTQKVETLCCSFAGMKRAKERTPFTVLQAWL